MNGNSTRTADIIHEEVNMAVLNEFINKVLNTDESFILKGDEYNYFYTQGKIGNAKCIFGARPYRQEWNSIHMKDELNLVALLVNQKVYIIDPWSLGIRYREQVVEYPENVIPIEQAVKAVNEMITCDVFSRWYDALPCDNEISEENESIWMHYAKRTALSYNEDGVKAEFINCYEQQDIIDILCEGASFKEVAIKKLEDNRDAWIKKKTKNLFIEDAIRRGKAALPYEVEIAEELNQVEAKFVNVEFLLNGKTAACKLSPEEIRRTMINNDFFSYYDFQTRKEGERVSEELGAGRWRENGNDVLTCEHIVKITYGRKTLYERGKFNG